MLPEAMETSQQAISLLSETLKGLPVLAVMWYMLRDVRVAVKELSAKVSHMEVKVAADDSRVRIDHVNEKLTEAKIESRTDIEKLLNRVLLLENQITAMWAKVGTRPEDIKHRTGECA